MSCCEHTASIARQTARMLSVMRAGDPLFHWRTATRAFWPKSRRRHPVAIIENTLHRRTYQCLACGAELTIENHDRQNAKQRAQVAHFAAQHNALRCPREQS